jgi:hypothetical protein
LVVIMSRISSQDYEEIYRRQQGRDLNVKPRPYKPKDSLTDRELEQIRQLLIAFVQS